MKHFPKFFLFLVFFGILFCRSVEATYPSKGNIEGMHEARDLKITSSETDYYLSVCAIFQNEADYLKEWIEYHKLLGVEHFWLYNNRSTDHYLEVLEPYIEIGEVELIDWPYVDYPACQLTAYADGITKATDTTYWLAIIDIDEFLVPQQCDDMITFLQEFEKFSQILINWQLFGTSNIQSLPKDALIIEALTYKFPTYFNSYWSSNSFVKAIVKPNHVSFPITSSHYCNLLPGYLSIDGAKKVVPPFSLANINILRIQLNHYWFRTLDFFFNVKVDRRKNTDDPYPQDFIDWILKLGNSEQDLSIQRFVPLLKEAMQKTVQL